MTEVTSIHGKKIWRNQGARTGHPVTRMIEIDGRTQSLRQWAEETGIAIMTIRQRLRRGWLARQAVGLRPGPCNRPGPKTRVSLEPDYMRRRNAERRRKAISIGICVECVSDKAEEGRTKCAGCLSINRQRLRIAA